METDDSVMVNIRGKNTGKKVICDKVRKGRGKYVSIMVLENQESAENEAKIIN